MAFRYGELKFDYGDEVVLADGEKGIVTGFIGRGRNRVMLKLAPATNGNERMRIIDATDVADLNKKLNKSDAGSS